MPNTRPIRPLKLDPTRTGLLRKGMVRAIEGRFNKLRRLLKEHLRSLVTNAPLRLSPEKLTAFNQWLEQMVNEHILERRGGGEVPWTIGWAEQAYRMGLARSYDTVKKPALRKAQEHAIGKKEFLSITGRIAETKIKILAARAFEDLKGITQAMSAAISRELVSGVLSNASMEDIAQAIDARVEGIGINRARLLARNEVVHAFSEATLDGFEALGVEEVGVSVEWSTTNKPCKLCAPLAKMRLPVAQARGLFPRHPNCLCTPIPAYSKPDLEAAREAIEESVDEEAGHSEWAGEDLLDTLPEDSD